MRPKLLANSAADAGEARQSVGSGAAAGLVRQQGRE